MRIEALRKYMFELLDELLTDKKYVLKVDFLEKDINSYSLNRIPTEPIVEKWITGQTIKQDTYNFMAKKTYGADVNNSLQNIGFYEDFERKIEENNRNKVLPQIDGILSIECLNCGSISIVNTKECIFTIQIRIKYMEGNNGN